MNAWNGLKERLAILYTFLCTAFNKTKRRTIKFFDRACGFTIKICTDLASNKRAAVDSAIIAMISLMVIAIVGLAMTPEVVNQVQNIDTTGWNFTGHEAAETMLGLIPLAWVIGLALLMIVGMFGMAKRYGAVGSSRRKK